MSAETAKSPNGFQLMSTFLRSSVGAKFLMAITGLLMWGFVIGHLAGNLQVFLPASAGGYVGKQLNEYAHFLKSTPALLWGTRIALLISVVLHIVSGLRLARLNREARGQQYAKWQPRSSTLASRYMTISGLVVLSFIVFHLLHFTVGVVDPAFMDLRDEAGLHDVHKMMWEGFRNPAVAGFYAISIILLMKHLSHGSVSLFQSLGIRSRAWTPVIALGARGMVVLLLLGFVAIPLFLCAGRLIHGG